jgi:hypothetical protein
MANTVRIFINIKQNILHTHRSRDQRASLQQQQGGRGLFTGRQDGGQEGKADKGGHRGCWHREAQTGSMMAILNKSEKA